MQFHLPGDNIMYSYTDSYTYRGRYTKFTPIAKIYIPRLWMQKWTKSRAVFIFRCERNPNFCDPILH